MSVIPWIVASACLLATTIYFLIQTAKERQANMDLRADLGRANGERTLVLDQLRLERREDLQAKRRLADIHEFAKGLLESLNAIEITSRGEADYASD